MQGWNTGPFLQALGWAVLNSIWQMAAIWLLILAIQQLHKLSGYQKYLLSVTGFFAGFAWFLATFFQFYISPAEHAALPVSFFSASEILPVLLSSSSIAYLILLLIPVVRIIQNWRFIQKIKAQGLQKPDAATRLFVNTMRLRLGIKKSVPVYLSKLVTSPVTIGFFKPVILVPVAALLHLNTHQVEAILLHELSHIRRHDYLINLLLTLVHVVLYFNPFAKLILKKIELEREGCCDELVLQCGYENVSYAAALLQLERSSQQLKLAMAANKNHLLYRVETIVGMKTKPAFKTSDAAGIIAGLAMLLFVNAFLPKAKKPATENYSLTSLLQPARFFVNEPAVEQLAPSGNGNNKKINFGTAAAPSQKILTDQYYFESRPAFVPAGGGLYSQNEIVPVQFNEADAALTQEQKDQVQSTLENTKKVLKVQWKDVELAIGDAMTEREKKVAKTDYLNEIESVNWHRLENNLKAGYEKIDWEKVNGTVAEVLVNAKLDSLEICYSLALEALNKPSASCSTAQILPLPDASVKELDKTKTYLKASIQKIQGVRTKKIIRL